MSTFNKEALGDYMGLSEYQKLLLPEILGAVADARNMDSNLIVQHCFDSPEFRDELAILCCRRSVSPLPNIMQ